MAALNQLAAHLAQQATDDAEPQPENPKAQAGREGGKRGGRARADKLTAAQRSEIARKAAEALWRPDS